MWFFIQVVGRDTGNVSTQKKQRIVKAPIFYTREFTQEKPTMNFLQSEPALFRICAH